MSSNRLETLLRGKTLTCNKATNFAGDHIAKISTWENSRKSRLKRC